MPWFFSRNGSRLFLIIISLFKNELCYCTWKYLTPGADLIHALHVSQKRYETMKEFISKPLLHLPIRVILKGKRKAGAATTPSHSASAKFGDVGVVVTGSGSPTASASPTNWIKLRWWKTSCMPPLRHHATLSRAGISGWLSPRRAWRVADVKASWGKAEVGAQAGAGWGSTWGFGTHRGAASAAPEWHMYDSYLPDHAKRK